MKIRIPSFTVEVDAAQYAEEYCYVPGDVRKNIVEDIIGSAFARVDQLEALGISATVKKVSK